MMLRSLSIFLVWLFAAFKAGESIRLQEWFGLRLPSQSRELQSGVFPLCASEFSGRNGHLLANLNSKGKVLQKWVPAPDQDFLALVNLDDGTFTLTGTIIPKGAKNLNNALELNFVYSDPVSFTSCYCASVEFLGDLTKIDYSRIEKKCNLDNFLARPDTNADQLFCPTCEANQCTVASKDPTAPNPIYSDWLFFQEVTGSLTGPGIGFFYELIKKGFDTEGEFDQCTPDITNLPLPQLGCSNFANPDEGKGFGVNGKNQKCGFASWFNCEEILDQLGGDNIRVHVADINLELEPCPPELLTPSPTLPIITTAPTVSPTTSPTVSPTNSPTLSPTPVPTVSPTNSPTESPTASPTTSPTVTPTASPTTSPTVSPTTSPTTTPTLSPTQGPTTSPTTSPTVSPTVSPTGSPTVSPTQGPTTSPTTSPTESPTVSPTTSPTTSPTVSPTTTPTTSPTESPTVSPTTSPTVSPTQGPTTSPTTSPTGSPTVSPTTSPTTSPTVSPTQGPTTSPTISPTVSPTVSPTQSPTTSPTVSPTQGPTTSPTTSPTASPTVSPTQSPSTSPTVSPTQAPTTSPTTSPTNSPTVSPTPAPTGSPTVSPTPAPTTSPTLAPTNSPTVSPTLSPTPCPKPKPCRKIKVCVPCKFFPDVETCEEEFEELGWLGWLADDAE